MSLATFSQEVKVFNTEDNYSLPVVAPIQSVNSSHGKITWSGDGKWLAVAPFDRGGGNPLPIFKYVNKKLQPMTYVTLPNVTSASFYSWTNRHIAVGNENGEILVWDIKAKKIAFKVECVDNQTVDLLAVNSDDTYIASGSLSSNKIYLHGLTTNKVINTIYIPKSKETSSLRFCLCKRNYLGVSSIESTICIWDIAKSNYIFKKFQAHTGACTDISFSPINYDILASVSLTKTLKMHDIRDNKTVLNSNIGEPLNCVDIILNGDKIAMGTTGGSIIIYDLRADKILQTFKAHSKPVLAVKTQNLKISKSYTEVEISTPEVIENHSKTFDVSVMDVFSPITQSNTKEISSCLLASQSKILPSHSTPNLAFQSSQSPSPYDDSFLKKVLSPLPQQKSIQITSISQLSPYLCPIKEKPDSTDNINENVNIEIKNELYTPPQSGGGGGDGKEERNNDQIMNQMQEKHSHNDLLNEIRVCQQTILGEISLIKQDLKILKEDYNSLKKLLADDIMQVINTGNCQSIINHSSQRLLINELNETLLTSEDKISAEIKLNAFRLMHIYEAVKHFKG